MMVVGLWGTRAKLREWLSRSSQSRDPGEPGGNPPAAALKLKHLDHYRSKGGVEFLCLLVVLFQSVQYFGLTLNFSVLLRNHLVIRVSD